MHLALQIIRKKDILHPTRSLRATSLYIRDVMKVFGTDFPVLGGCYSGDPPFPLYANVTHLYIEIDIQSLTMSLMSVVEDEKVELQTDKL